jgi:peptide/nickel transport system permease protein
MSFPASTGGKVAAFSRHAAIFLGVLFLIIALLPTIIGPFFVSPVQSDVLSDIPNLPPDSSHPLGTQSEGRDVLAVLMHGTPATLTIGLIGGGVALVVGSALGFIAGFFGRRTDAIISTLVDIGLTIPPLAILILIGASFPVVTLLAMGIIVATTAWMSSARVIRAQVLSLKEREYVRVARLSGAGNFYIIFFELAPNLIPFLAANFVNAVTSTILASIGLEVLGLGPQQSRTLGSTIYEAMYHTAMWRGLWWWWLPPIIILVLIFLGLFLVSIGLDRYANPRLERH